MGERIFRTLIVSLALILRTNPDYKSSPNYSFNHLIAQELNMNLIGNLECVTEQQTTALDTSGSFFFLRKILVDAHIPALILE